MKAVYLAGAIQFAHSTPWRDVISSLYRKNNWQVFNPVEDNQHIFHPSIMGYKNDGTVYTLEELKHGTDRQRLKAEILCRQTEENDKYFISKADLIIMYFDDRANQGYGTKREFEWAYDEFKLPIFFIRAVPVHNVPEWLHHRREEGLRRGIVKEFKTIEELKQYLIEKEGFKE